MKSILLGPAALLFGFSSPSYSQQKTETRNVAETVEIIGRLNDGSRTARSAPKKLSKLPIKSSIRHELPDCSLTINRVVPPVMPTPERKNQPSDSAFQSQTPVAVSLPSQTTVFVASVIDGRATNVSWKHEGEEFEIWSNIDWNVLTGFSTCRKGERIFTNMIMLSQQSNLSQPIPTNLSKKRGNYFIVKGNPDNANAFAAVDALHELYRTDYQRLDMACALRKKNIEKRKLEEASQSAERPNFTINLWKIERGKKQ